MPLLYSKTEVKIVYSFFSLLKIELKYFQSQNIWGVTFHSLLVTRWNSLVARCKICLLMVAEVACCKKSLVTRCKIRSLLVAEVARCKNSLVTRCKIRSLLVAKIHSLFVANFACYSRQQVTCYLMQKIIHHTLKLSQVLKERWKI